MRFLLILGVVWLLGTCRSAPPELPGDLFCSRIASFVIEREGRWLALEFRSEGELNSVNRRIRSSFVVLPVVKAD